MVNRLFFLSVHLGRSQHSELSHSGLLMVSSVQAARFTLNVVDPDGNPVSGFRWLVEEDNTHPVIPGERPAGNSKPTSTKLTTANNVLALDFAASHAPVAFKNAGVNAGKGLSGSTGRTLRSTSRSRFTLYSRWWWSSCGG